MIRLEPDPSAGYALDAVIAANRSITLDDSNIDPHLVVSASCAATGSWIEARRAMQKVFGLNPEFNLHEYAATQPYKNQHDRDVFLNQLLAVMNQT